VAAVEGDQSRGATRDESLLTGTVLHDSDDVVFSPGRLWNSTSIVFGARSPSSGTSLLRKNSPESAVTVSDLFWALGSILTRTLKGEGANACAGVTRIVIRSLALTGSATATHNPQSQILMATTSWASKATRAPASWFTIVRGQSRWNGGRTQAWRGTRAQE